MAIPKKSSKSITSRIPSSPGLSSGSTASKIFPTKFPIVLGIPVLIIFKCIKPQANPPFAAVTDSLQHNELNRKTVFVSDTGLSRIHRNVAQVKVAYNVSLVILHEPLGNIYVPTLYYYIALYVHYMERHSRRGISREAQIRPKYLARSIPDYYWSPPGNLLVHAATLLLLLLLLLFLRKKDIFWWILALEFVLENRFCLLLNIACQYCWLRERILFFLMSSYCKGLVGQILNMDEFDGKYISSLIIKSQ